MIRKPVSTKRKASSSSESDEEPPLKIQIKDVKRKKKDESDDESEDVKEIKKKDVKKQKKAESDEEVDETSSSDKQDSPKKSKALSGMVIALSGKLSMTSAEIAKLIEKNGGKFAKTITQDVTHVICANTDDKTKKLTKAKEDGKTLVDEKFLKKKINL